MPAFFCFRAVVLSELDEMVEACEELEELEELGEEEEEGSRRLCTGLLAFRCDRRGVGGGETECGAVLP